MDCYISSIGITHFQSKLKYYGSVKDVKIPIPEDADGQIWVGSTKGTAAFSLQTKEFSYFSFRNDSGYIIDDVNVTALFKDKNGKLWVGTTSGLFNYSPISNQQ